MPGDTPEVKFDDEAAQRGLDDLEARMEELGVPRMRPNTPDPTGLDEMVTLMSGVKQVYDAAIISGFPETFAFRLAEITFTHVVGAALEAHSR